MVVSSFKPLMTVVREVRWGMIPVFIYICIIAWADLQYHFEDYNFPVAMVAILGTLIALLLAFRTNSSYQRWWEARTLWGAIVNDSRTWTRQLLTFSRGNITETIADPILRQMAIRQIAFCFALSRELRVQTPTQDLSEFLDDSEIERYLNSRNVANDILLTQASELHCRYDANQLELFQFVELERTLKRLTDSMGGCERIKNTPFPMSYGRLVNGLIYLFVFFLPFGLFDMSAFALIATSTTMAFAFMIIDRVGNLLEDPFDSHPSDTPMLALSRTIEINIKQMLGETNLPEKFKPKNGVLY